MNKTILLTSFQPWLAHHHTNSSDDLLELAMATIESQQINGYQLVSLRQLPVDEKIASQMTIESIETIKPQFIICCGMAESYEYLTIESQATCQDVCLKTSLNLDRIICGLPITQIGYDAGKFVCEALYFNILNYLTKDRVNGHCLFIHVPILTTFNRERIISDFCRILTKISLMYSKSDRD